MADGQPEMIPNPGPGPQGPPGPVSRQLSPEEEREVLINFMGSMYGESKKIEGNIIGETNTLKKGGSQEIKKQIEQVFTQPQQPVPQQVQAAPIPNPPVQKLSVPTQVQTDEIPNIDTQLSFNFDISEKENLINQVETLIKKVNYNIKQTEELNKRVDKIIDNMTTTSLPIKKRVKKTS